MQWNCMKAAGTAEVSSRQIAISRIDTKKGEGKAHGCAIAWLCQLGQMARHERQSIGVSSTTRLLLLSVTTSVVPGPILLVSRDGVNMKLLRSACVGCLPFSLTILLAVAQVVAQEGDAAAAKQEKVAALKESLAQNQASLKTYSWTETTQISLKGEVKKQEQKQCQYGPDGKVQKIPVPGAPSEPQQQQTGGRGRRGGAVKKEIVEKKVGEMKDYMQQVAALVHQYVPPDPQKIQAAQAAGNVATQPGQQGLVTLTIKNYVKDGDSLALGFDSAAKKIRSYDVSSYLKSPKDDPVKLAVNFASLPDGTNYAQQSVLDAPGKNIQVKVTNSDYKKAGQ